MFYLLCLHPPHLQLSLTGFNTCVATQSSSATPRLWTTDFTNISMRSRNNKLKYSWSRFSRVNAFMCCSFLFTLQFIFSCRIMSKWKAKKVASVEAFSKATLIVFFLLNCNCVHDEISWILVCAIEAQSVFLSHCCSQLAKLVAQRTVEEEEKSQFLKKNLFYVLEFASRFCWVFPPRKSSLLNRFSSDFFWVRIVHEIISDHSLLRYC